MSFEKLFSPIKIRELELRNRVVMPAMGTHESAASEDGRMVTDKLIAYHVARAKGGCGLNTIEVCSVDAASAPTGFLSIADDRYIPGMKKLCSACLLYTSSLVGIRMVRTFPFREISARPR